MADKACSPNGTSTALVQFNHLLPSLKAASWRGPTLGTLEKQVAGALCLIWSLHLWHTHCTSANLCHNSKACCPTSLNALAFKRLCQTVTSISTSLAHSGVWLHPYEAAGTSSTGLHCLPWRTTYPELGCLVGTGTAGCCLQKRSLRIVAYDAGGRGSRSWYASTLVQHATFGQGQLPRRAGQRD
eukprot:scaffold221653_cov15-Tisochrysis_lutea.AAC.1